MPAYNEEKKIAAVVSAWLAEFDRLGIDYEFLAYDDGSRDETGNVLRKLAGAFPRLRVKSQPNQGHGPTILKGYREARGEWIFQIDSDGEMGLEGFQTLWSRREDYDFLVGCRLGRSSAFARRVVTAASSLTVRLLFGKGIRDVNSPYRLMRSSCLKPMLPLLPEKSFAPNVILSGLAGRRKLRIYETPVPHLGQKTVTRSLNKWRLWKTALRCFRETFGVALKGTV
jgi:glycosyltransferase involved in cell wall biosynthesis